MKNIQLEEAIDAGDASRVCTLLADRQGLDLEARDPVSGRTPLHRSVWRSAVLKDRSQHIIVGMLLKAQASPDAGDRYGLLPIVTAAGADDRSTLTLLLSYDANIYARHPLSTQTAIEQCEDFGNPAVMEILNERAAFLAEAAREAEARAENAQGMLRIALEEPLEEAGDEALIVIGRPNEPAELRRMAV